MALISFVTFVCPKPFLLEPTMPSTLCVRVLSYPFVNRFFQLVVSFGPLYTQNIHIYVQLILSVWYYKHLNCGKSVRQWQRVATLSAMCFGQNKTFQMSCWWWSAAKYINADANYIDGKLIWTLPVSYINAICGLANTPPTLDMRSDECLLAIDLFRLYINRLVEEYWFPVNYVGWLDE